MSPNFKILIGEVLQKIEFKVSIDQRKLSTLHTVIKFRSKKNMSQFSSQNLKISPIGDPSY